MRGRKVDTGTTRVKPRPGRRKFDVPKVGGVEAPPGFEEWAGQASAAERIRKRLADTQDALEALGREARISLHEYRNGEVDGEVVLDVTRGVDAVQLTRDLEAAFGMENQRGIWFQVGARFAVREGEEDEASGVVDRRRGMDEVGMYYRKMYSQDDRDRRSIFGDAFGQMEHRVVPLMEGKYGRKAQTVYVRLHWNPANEKPRR